MSDSDSGLRRICLLGLKVALVVGTVLNLINQGGVLFSGRWRDVVVWQVCLNYAVPFLVSVFSSIRSRKR